MFIIGFLLSSVLADYKEAERLPAELRVALEAIHDDNRCFGRLANGYDAEALMVRTQSEPTIGFPQRRVVSSNADRFRSCDRDRPSTDRVESRRRYVYLIGLRPYM